MITTEKHIAEGYITVVQEQRFRLVTDTGQGLLLTLAEETPLDISDLQHMHNTNTHVVVEYEGEPNLLSGVAHSIKPSNRRSAQARE